MNHQIIMKTATDHIMSSATRINDILERYYEDELMTLPRDTISYIMGDKSYDMEMESPEYVWFLTWYYVNYVTISPMGDIYNTAVYSTDPGVIIDTQTDPIKTTRANGIRYSKTSTIADKEAFIVHLKLKGGELERVAITSTLDAASALESLLRITHNNWETRK